ncbi:uncharacterized protein UV8b_00471 [Ustilaginoidea virens]|uniref:NEDD8-activating enzyme E1 regulatory subunit n=1 Tax=Ustilaginoidea virens TaxID=1159556 RepID=A0A1B5KVH1_USTVR|nr:uncharacterized protein UV8b_00471 [Ustilaginoidea virens]QUC16230.1 hypothetical protein UV8b_00471 [Ustilaginoidea virens]GAO15013.1 hypothetical protein UVI_02027620 [Ustilaginoidea virens]
MISGRQDETQSPLRQPTDKERKYDRQLRLWAASGQSALESAHVLLVNSSTGTVGTETLKNLVLPGIGKFTIVDDAVVGDADLGVNFFLDEACLGLPRARCCRDNLVELNPAVRGDWFPKIVDSDLGIERLLDSSDPFTIILYTLPLRPTYIKCLESHAKKHGIPLLAVHSVGYYAYFTVKLPGLFPVIDTHPDETAVVDLRLLDPWSELAEFADQMTKDIDDQDDFDHGHLPLVVILLHYLKKWREAHGGGLPLTYSDKVSFRDFVARGARTKNPEGGEENFDEAVAAVMKHVSRPSLPTSLERLFEREGQIKGDTEETFWTIIKAVKHFYHKHRQLPLPGSLPDMKAQSKVYVHLQSLYKDKAKRDIAEILDIVRAIPGGAKVKRDEVELFCKNASFVKVIENPENAPITNQVVAQELLNVQDAATAGFQSPHSLAPIYLALNALRLSPEAGREEIIDLVTTSVPCISGNQRLAQVAEELSRSGSGELHNVSAVVGGLLAQEMIKIITKQYAPVDNTCIFDGIESRCQVLRLKL